MKNVLRRSSVEDRASRRVGTRQAQSLRHVLLAGASLLCAEYVPPEWEYRRTINVERAGEVHRARLDAAAMRHMQPDGSDLRIDLRGTEVAYVARALRGSTREIELRPEVLNKGYVPAVGTQVTLHVGTPAKHSRLRIESSESNYRRRVRIETSPDGRRWALVRRDGYVLDFDHDDRRIRALAVDYPVSTERYVRATLEGWEKPETLTGATLLLRETVPAELVTVATLEAGAAITDKGVAEYRLDAGVPAPWFDRVRVETEEGEYHRAARLSASDDDKQWRFVASGFLSRVGSETSLTLEGGTARRWRYLKLEVFHQDDRPVRVLRVHLEAPAWEVKFLPREAGRYLLCYGNLEARRPSYDLPAVLARRDTSGEVAVALGAEERNASYRPREKVVPWTERHPELLYGTLAAAVVGLGYVTVRFLLKLRASA